MEFTHPVIMSYPTRAKTLIPFLGNDVCSPGDNECCVEIKFVFRYLVSLVQAVSQSEYLSPMRLRFAVHIITGTFRWTPPLGLVDKTSKYV
jgi:hypothetical protein